MKSLIKAFFKKYPALRRVYLNYINFGYGSKNRLPWRRVCHRSDWFRLENKTPKINKKVLMATCMGGHFTTIDMETLLSVALSLRGANVHALICDRFLPACLMCYFGMIISVKKFAANGPSRLYCKRCFESGIEAYQSTGIKVHLFSEYITQQDLRDVEMLVEKTPFERIRNYVYRDLAVGEHAMAGALRFFARGSIDEEPYAHPVLKRYFKASLLTAIVLQKMQNEQEFDVAVFTHGIYIPYGVAGEFFRKEGVPVVNWNIAYREATFIFSHYETYHHTMMTEPVSNWKSISWNSELEHQVMNYIKNRSKGISKDWHVFLNEPSGNIGALGVDSSKPAIGLLTNVFWDAQLHYPANMFKDMLQWIFKTIEYFAKKPDLQLVIRVHPAEITGDPTSRQLVVEEIKKAFPALPSNIFVVAPESKLNTYALMEACNAVIIYGTKTGVELTSFGIPVIVAGEAWIRNKGITVDPETQRDYFEVLDRLPFNSRMNSELKQRARQYAYHFFFRRMVPVEVLRPADSANSLFFYFFLVDVKNLADLMPGKNIGLDVICKGILSGEDFIYEHEKIIADRRLDHIS